MKKQIRDIYRTISRWWLRKRLKNHNFSIICNTCIGGIIYHELGEKFLSPTINMWFEDKDFPKFAQNLRWYLEQPLRFVKGIDATPTAYCGDILIHFIHYHSDEEANKKWIERSSRVNYDNLFFIFSDRPDINRENGLITHEDMLSVRSLGKGSVVFSIRQYDDIDYIIPLRKDPRGEYVNVYMNDRYDNFLHRWYWERKFNFVKWLNTGEI